MKNFKGILNIGLAVIVIACVAISAFLLKQKVALLQQLDEKQFQIDVVEEENQKLTSENDSLKRDLEANKEVQQNFTQVKSDLEAKLKAAEERSTVMEADLKDAQWKLEQLKTENIALTKENETLKAKQSAPAPKPQAEASSSAAPKEPPKKKLFFF
jgi:regulator of replication initiation timing